jgi:hypothetical protein
MSRSLTETSVLPVAAYDCREAQAATGSVRTGHLEMDMQLKGTISESE